MSGLRKIFGDCWKSLHVDASTFIDAKFAFARNGAFSLDTRSKVIEAEAELEDDEEDEGESETFDSRGGDGIRVRGFTSKICPEDFAIGYLRPLCLGTKAKIIQDEGALPEYDSIFGGGRAKGKVQTRECTRRSKRTLHRLQSTTADRQPSTLVKVFWDLVWRLVLALPRSKRCESQSSPELYIPPPTLRVISATAAALVALSAAVLTRSRLVSDTPAYTFPPTVRSNRCRCIHSCCLCSPPICIHDARCLS